MDADRLSRRLSFNRLIIFLRIEIAVELRSLSGAKFSMKFGIKCGPSYNNLAGELARKSRAVGYFASRIARFTLDKKGGTNFPARL